MNYKFKKIIYILLPAAWLAIPGFAFAQSQQSDSLSLESIISEVVQNHPAIKKAQQDLTVSDAKIGMAKSATLPTVGFESSYSRMGPVTTITLPEMGSFSLMPHDAYSASLSANQVLYDFGKTRKNIDVETEGKQLSSMSVEQVKQKLSQAVISNYFALVYLQEALNIKDEQLKTLNEHLAFIRKKLETGSATSYEVLTTQVRISNTESQKTDIETAIKIRESQLNSLLGRAGSAKLLVKKKMQLALADMPGDTLLANAFRNRDEMKLALEKDRLAQMRKDLTGLQNKPVVSAFANTGLKNGYIPDMYKPRGNFVAGVGVKVPVFDAHRKEYALTQAQAAIDANTQEIEITRRGIESEVVEANTNLQASETKVEQAALQLQQARRAYEMAKVKFDAGVITNLELIESSTSVSESELMLMKSKVDCALNSFNLKSAIGQRLY